jgi:hypothetical protein
MFNSRLGGFHRGQSWPGAGPGLRIAPPPLVADAGRRLDRWGDAIFAPFGLGPADVAALRAAFASWPR